MSRKISSPKSPSNKIRVAYDAARELHRHESALLFGQVTVYVGIVGVIANAVLKEGNQNSFVAAGLFGMFLGLPYLAITFRVTKHMRDACKVAEECERRFFSGKALDDFSLYYKRRKPCRCGGKFAAKTIVSILMLASVAMAIYGLLH
jgi:hypothetical protein